MKIKSVAGRMVVAVTAGVAFSVGYYATVIQVIYALAWSPAGAPEWMLFMLAIGTLAMMTIVPLVTFWLLTPSFVADGHTRCGHCGYILRGLQEPRCPECGEPI